jgi:hypothetical protein
MAEAVKKTHTRTVSEVKVTITLTSEEAEALAAVVGSVGGDIESTPRKHTDAVFWALSKAGVKTSGLGDHPSGKLTGGLRFHKSTTEARIGSGVYTTPDFLRKLGY